MTDIVNPRDCKPHAPDSELSDPVAAGVKLIKGALYGLDVLGNAVKLTSGGTALIARGEVLVTVDNTDGDAGDVKVRGRAGSFEQHILEADAVTRADIGKTVYSYDDHTIARTYNSGARPKTGKLMAITPGGNAVVKVGPAGELDGDVVAANNLSDVTAATARANLVANLLTFTCRATNLVGADATRYGFVAPRAMTITSIKSVLLGAALATGNATLTGKIATVAITTGVLTITQSGSAIGDVDTCSPSAANVAAAGDFVEFLVGGTNADTDAFAEITVMATY